jgi:hypothetical protein
MYGKFWFRFALSAALFATGFSAFADDGSADPVTAAIADVCQNGQAEGQYFIAIPTLGTARVMILCKGTVGIVATIYNMDASMFQTMVHIAVDNDTMSFLSYDPSGSDIAPGKLPSPELQVSLAALKQGELIGKYRNASMTKPLDFSIKKSAPFPNVLAQMDTTRGYTKLEGRYVLENPEKLAFKLVGKGYITIDFLNGQQRAFLNDSGTNSLSIDMFSGLPAKATSNFSDVFVINSGVDDGTYGASIINEVRGHLVSDDEIEFYFINTQLGLTGPFRALRDKTGDLVIDEISLPTQTADSTNPAPAHAKVRVSNPR